MRLLALALLSTAALTSNAAADVLPQLGFDPRPTYLGPREVALTFDDAPGWTEGALAVLDVLRERGVRATFFVNTGPEATSLDARARTVLTRVVEDGHDLGSHGRNHRHLTSLGEATLRTEIFGVQADLAQLGLRYPISLFRAAFGEPYLAHYQRELGWEVDDAGYEWIAPIAAERMVHVGWNIDSDDWRCPSDAWAGGICAFENVRAKLERGDHGIILMHANSPRTAPALALLLDYLDTHGYQVVTVEDAVYNVYGASSAEVIAELNAGAN